jgi:hypothetical protein
MGVSSGEVATATRIEKEVEQPSRPEGAFHSLQVLTELLGKVPNKTRKSEIGGRSFVSSQLFKWRLSGREFQVFTLVL